MICLPLKMISNPAAFILRVLLLLSVAVGAVNPEDSLAENPSSGTAGSAEGHVKIPVFYLTNRNRREGPAIAYTYGGKRGEPRFGRCEVEFRPIPITFEGSQGASNSTSERRKCSSS